MAAKAQGAAKSLLGTLLMVFLSLGLLGGGGYLIFSGLNQPPEKTPDVEEPLYAPLNQVETGPQEAVVTERPVAPPTPGVAPPPPAEKKMTQADMKPGTLFIPAISAYAPLDAKTGKISEGKLTLPPAEEVTQWDKGSTLASKEGSILIAGHVSLGNVRGALYNLAHVKPGNVAYLKDSSGRVGEFQLESLVPVKKAALPKSVWSTKGPKRLVLVTCGGELNKQPNGSWHFDSNIVATFREVPKAPTKKVATKKPTSPSKASTPKKKS